MPGLRLNHRPLDRTVSPLHSKCRGSWGDLCSWASTHPPWPLNLGWEALPVSAFDGAGPDPQDSFSLSPAKFPGCSSAVRLPSSQCLLAPSAAGNGPDDRSSRVRRFFNMHLYGSHPHFSETPGCVQPSFTKHILQAQLCSQHWEQRGTRHRERSHTWLSLLLLFNHSYSHTLMRKLISQGGSQWPRVTMVRTKALFGFRTWRIWIILSVPYSPQFLQSLPGGCRTGGYEGGGRTEGRGSCNGWLPIAVIKP